MGQGYYLLFLISLSWLVIFSLAITALTLVPLYFSRILQLFLVVVVASIGLHMTVNGAAPLVVDARLIQKPLILGTLLDPIWLLFCGLGIGATELVRWLLKRVVWRERLKIAFLMCLLCVFVIPIHKQIRSSQYFAFSPLYMLSGSVDSSLGDANWPGLRHYGIELQNENAVPSSIKTDIVLVLIEGLSANDLTLERMPKLWSIAQDHLFFPNVLTHQRQTNRGLFSILCGEYPNMVSRISKSDVLVASGQQAACVPSVIKEHGYTSYFYQSAPLGYMSKDKFAYSVGFDQVFGEEHFPSVQDRGPWGVPDHYVFERLLNDITSTKAPTFRVILTTATHHPYWVDGTASGREGALTYTDNVVADFIDRLRETRPGARVLITGDEAGVPSDSGLLPDWNHSVAVLVDRVSENTNGKTIEDVRGHIDFAPTVVNFAGGKWPWGSSLIEPVPRKRLLYAANHYKGEVYRVSQKGIQICEKNLDCEDKKDFMEFVSGNDITTEGNTSGVLFSARDIKVKSGEVDYIFGRVITEVEQGAVLELSLEIEESFGPVSTAELISWDCDEKVTGGYRVKFPIRTVVTRFEYTQIAEAACHKLYVHNASREHEYKISRVAIKTIPFPAGGEHRAPAPKSDQGDSFDRSPVSHAGGIVEGYTYTNSIEAFELRAEEGYKLLEVDMQWTQDGVLVCGHDWRDNWFGEGGYAPAYNEWRSKRTGLHMTPCDMEELGNFLEQYPDRLLVSDIKNNNIDGLRYIMSKYPEVAAHLVPQIHNIAESEVARELGFDKLIYTLYRDRRPNKLVYHDVAQIEPVAVTMPVWRMKTGAANYLSKHGYETYVHTLNEVKQLEEACLHWGVSSVYTDLSFRDIESNLSQFCVE